MQKTSDKKVVIDGDIFLYKIGFGVEDCWWWNKYNYTKGIESEKIISYHSDMEVLKTSFKEHIVDISKETESNNLEFVLSGSTNFRYLVDPTYKHNRVGVRKPLLFDEFKEWISDLKFTTVVNGIEADDYVSYRKRQDPKNVILVAVDKDVLKQNAGKHYNPVKQEWIETSKEEAIQFAYFQTLTGDQVDGYKGCPGIGEKRATAILEYEYDPVILWAKVCETYKKKGLSEFDALVQMRLANMHQYTSEGVVLYLPPNYLTITHR